MIKELPEVWLKRDRTLARYVGAYLVCDLFQVPCFNLKIKCFLVWIKFQFFLYGKPLHTEPYRCHCTHYMHIRSRIIYHSFRHWYIWAIHQL